MFLCVIRTFVLSLSRVYTGKRRLHGDEFCRFLLVTLFNLLDLSPTVCRLDEHAVRRLESESGQRAFFTAYITRKSFG